MLIDAIKEQGVEGRTLLDIGGGVGAIQHELLKMGARSVMGVDASIAYIEATKDEAERQGHSDRLHVQHGDFTNMASDIESADIVTLDRVICCYHDVERLVGLSSERAERLYGLVYPHDNWLFKSAFKVFNLLLWLRRSQFRVFIHSTAVVDALARHNGLRRQSYRKTLLWQVVLYARDVPGDANRSVQS